MTIIAPHEVTDEAKVETIAASMREHGWVGHPILIDDDESNEPKAITGTHRIAAAELAGIDVEYYSLADTDIDIGALFFDCNDDEDRLAVIEQGTDERAIEIMRAEVESN